MLAVLVDFKEMFVEQDQQSSVKQRMPSVFYFMLPTLSNILDPERERERERVIIHADKNYGKKD